MKPAVKRFLARATVLVAVLALAQSTMAAPILLNGETFSVADAFVGPSGIGTHFHSDDGGSFGQPPDLAEVGELGDEEVRGLSEFDITGLSKASTATLQFSVQSPGGLFGQGPGTFTVDIFSYAGNNAEDLSDFEIATSGSIGSFSTAGLVAGNVLLFDVTTLLQSAIANGDLSFGVKLQKNGSTDLTAYTFEDFIITGKTPEPGTWILVGTGLLALLRCGTRKRNRREND